MPFPSDEEIMKTAGELVAQLHGMFGKHPGMRPAHAKGLLITGTFTPTAEAGKLSSAKHFTDPSTPILVRFSNGTGLPQIPDADPNASPRGMAVRFNLGTDVQGHRVHTDIIAHSTPLFPVRTGEQFLAFLQAVATSGPGSGSPSPIEKFLGAHPSALKFVQAPKPTPSSYARDEYYTVSALKLVDANGKATIIRYTVTPELGVDPLDDAVRSGKPVDFLQDELKERLGSGGSVGFILKAQIAEEGDASNDATVVWPKERAVVTLGRLTLDKALEKEESDKEQKYVIFDPIPRVKGVEPSDDPLLEMRAALYLLSGKERRAA